ncbi:helix-turn-helix domain-containing protein [Psychroserpens algicola]|uniref:helix-turn-helix domain-containing protein n=1 Tax=Psychroserpens algicola TaxID=1719034 RepID=UPI0019538E2D|nr:helix-turn-helix domain-containing protein [Psychroserpens algicola]
MRRFIVPIIICMVLSMELYAQKSSSGSTNTPFSKLDYEAIVDNISKHQDNPQLLFKYINAFTKKAKKENDTLQLIRSYSFAIFYSKLEEHKIKFADSIISISNKPAYRSNFINAYYLRGIAYYNMNSYDKALEDFLKVKKLNSNQDFDYELDLQADYNIGIIKNRIGEYEASVKLFKKAYNYYVQEEDAVYALNILPSIVDAYINLKKTDSSSHYNNLLIKKIDTVANKDLFSYYLLNEGAIDLQKKEYISSIHNINKAIPYLNTIEDYHNLQFCYYYLGANYSYLNNEEAAINNLKKMDSMFIKINDVHPNTRKGYELLINYHKKNKDETNELVYVNRLLGIDSVLTKNYKRLSKTMFKEYDTPKLLVEKERIINTINDKNQISKKYLSTAAIVLIILVIVVIYYFNENKKNKRKFESLFNKNKDIENTPIQIKSDDTINLNINSDVIDDILLKLETFEKNNDFINSNLTLNSLAKDFETNSKYLSKIVNHYKNKNFSNYLNDLRIDYAVHKLQHENVFRNYTIKAIGNEVGFNSAESFSKAFHKSTGLKPSFFLRQLNK